MKVVRSVSLAHSLTKKHITATVSVCAFAATAIVLASVVTPGGQGGSTVGTSELTRGPANPILRNNSSFDDLKVGPSTVVKFARGDYRQWYEAIDAQNTIGTRDFLTQTAYAVSSDGTTWTKKGIVFAPQPAPSWEKSEVSPTSMHWDGSKWILYYHGGNNTGPRAIGRATSPTGTGSFTRDPVKPVLERGAPGAWDEAFVADAKVIPPWDGPDSLWRMYYVGRTSAGNGRVGLATSSNGITFKKVGSAPVVGFGAPGAWDDGNIQAFTPEWDEELGMFRAWYVARRAGGGREGGNAGYLWSTDGVNWTRDPSNPVLTSIPGDHVEDSIDSYLDEGRYRLVYGQYNLDASPPLRGKGEAWLAPEEPPPPPPPPPPPSTSTSTPPPTSPPPPTSGTVTTFGVSADFEDGDVERGDSSYPPRTHDATDGGTSNATMLVRRSKASPSYHPVRVALLRFDTSALPDDATVVSAELRLYVTVRNDTDGRKLVAEWYPASAWPVGASDWALDDVSSAHSGTALGAITLGQQNAFPLQGLAAIDRKGTTALRLHVSGSATAPAGPNDLGVATVEHASLPAPLLTITYRSG